MHVVHTLAGNAVRDHFLADHTRLELLFQRVVRAFGQSNPEIVALRWDDFESMLEKHVSAEEKYVYPHLMQTDVRAYALMMEHQNIRKRLAELSVQVDLHTLTLSVVRTFVDELRVHAKKEDAILHEWADAGASSCPSSSRPSS